MTIKKGLLSLLLFFITFPISHSYAMVFHEGKQDRLEATSYSNFSLIETIPVYLDGKQQELNEVYTTDELLGVKMEWDVKERAIYIGRNGEQERGDREGILPITTTSIQISNYLIEGFVVEGKAYGFFHEIMEAIGATTFSGCTELFFIYHEQEYWIDLTTGNVFMNGEQIPLESNPLLVGSELVIPLAFLTELLAIKIRVLEEYNTILVLQYYYE